MRGRGKLDKPILCMDRNHRSSATEHNLRISTHPSPSLPIRRVYEYHPRRYSPKFIRQSIYQWRSTNMLGAKSPFLGKLSRPGYGIDHEKARVISQARKDGFTQGTCIQFLIRLNWISGAYRAKRSLHTCQARWEQGSLVDISHNQRFPLSIFSCTFWYCGVPGVARINNSVKRTVIACIK